MKTKICTSIKQSKKLIELGIDVNTADMWYQHIGYSITDGKEKPTYFPMVIRDNISDDDIPIWSLSALRACLPPGISIDGILYVFESHKTFDNEWVYEYKFEDISAPLYSKSSNEIDAAVEMIIQLKENKMI